MFIECIKHENDQLYENFFAAIVCRFWGHSGRIYVQCNRHVPFEECYDCIINAALYVLKNRVWENVNSSLYNDPTGPDKAMHIAIKRERSIMLSRHNAKKRLSNFMLWQSAYSELIFIDDLWPDLKKETLYKIFEEYSKRNRRFGKE